MADYAGYTWVEQVTKVGPTRMNAIEAGIKDAAQNSKQRDVIANRPVASAATKNWIWTDSATNAVFYCDGSNWYPISTPSSWVAVAAVLTTSATIFSSSGPGITPDGYSPVAGDRILVVGQTDPTQNGIYIQKAAPGGWRRADDASISQDFTQGRAVKVINGAKYARSEWMYTGPSNPTIGTGGTSLTFKPMIAANVPRARVEVANAFSVANSAWQAIALDTVVVDTDSMFDATNHRLVCQTAGTYLVAGGVHFNTGAGDQRHAAIAVNGKPLTEQTGGNPQTDIAQRLSMDAGFVDLAVGDAINVYAWQNSGAALGLALTDTPSTTAGRLNFLSAVRVAG